jgi:hypothetical protein
MECYIVTILILSLIVISYINHRKNIKLLCTVSSLNRGTRAERRLIIKMLKMGVHPKTIFHDLYLQKKNGDFSQIDIVVAIPQGLLSIEIKDYSGWLFGNEKQLYWTQILNYGKEKYRFYNPIMQNAGHIKTLREQSKQLANLPIFNIVLFAGNCTLKNVNYWTENTFVGYTGDISHVLKKIKELCIAPYSDKREVARLLRQAVKNGENQEIVINHINSVQRRTINSHNKL